MKQIDILSNQVRTTLQLPENQTISLSDWLEGNQFNLNLRCGAKNLCNGCKVKLITDEGSKTVKACQTSTSDIDESVIAIEIPQTSLSDQSLHGVSEFEIFFEAGHKPSAQQTGIGLAIDLGTTTVAGCLWRLSDQSCLASASIANAQINIGDNVLTRIEFGCQGAENTKELQTVLIEGSINPLIVKLCEKAAIEADAITSATVAGNPVMLHTLSNLPLNGFSSYPFKPEFLQTKSIQSTEVGMLGNFPITLLPSAGCFVGSDIVAGALAAGMLDGDSPSLLIDFGTNGEILLKVGAKFYATATAAGPAFEGGRLNCGSPAKGAVISSLNIQGSSWIYTLCGKEEGEAIGISGAAYVDLIANGHAAGIINDFGRLDPTHPLVRDHQTHSSEVEKKISISDDIYCTEKDIAELLQAKGAIAAGVETLLEIADIEVDDLKKVYIAGGFGYHLNPEHALAFGLIPSVNKEKIHVIGNASLGGASLLLQENYQSYLEQIIENCEVVELNKTDCFEDHYIDALRVGPPE